jgi:hypothetical protein
MVALIVSGALVGAVLGMRYAVLSLVPVTLLGVVGLVTVGTIAELSWDTIVLLGAAMAAALQIGYILAVAGHHWLVLARARALKVQDADSTLPFPRA